jgi:tetratricopeptide (TPR) repeat protein
MLAQAHFFRHELDAFLAEAERAISLNPNNASALANVGNYISYVDDQRGVALVRRAMALDPFHPTWFFFSITRHHFKKGEYEEALSVAQQINLPDVYTFHLCLAAIYGELGRKLEARSALDGLLRVYPGFTIKKLIEERRKWNESDDMIDRWVAALRKAGLPD